MAEAQRLLNESIVKEYGKKGGKVVEMNQAVVNAVFAGDLPQEVKVPESWAKAVDVSTRPETGNEFVDIQAHLDRSPFLLLGARMWWSSPNSKGFYHLHFQMNGISEQFRFSYSN